MVSTLSAIYSPPKSVAGIFFATYNGRLLNNQEANKFVGQKISLNDPFSLIASLGVIDFLLTGACFDGTNWSFDELNERVEIFLDNSHAINPYAHFTYTLSDQNSKLEVYVDREKTDGKIHRIVYLGLNSRDQRINHDYFMLTESKLERQFEKFSRMELPGFLKARARQKNNQVKKRRTWWHYRDDL